MTHPRGSSGLPPRPNFSGQPRTAAAGPSRPPRQQPVNNSGYGAGYAQHAYQQYDASKYYYAQSPGFGWPVYAPHNMPYAYPYSFPYPGQPAQPQSFGQSLFAFRPTATPEGYSYSSTYQPEPVAPPDRRGPQSLPNKRARFTPSVNVKGGSNQAWRNCSYPGCNFVGSGHDVEVHEGDRHLIFPKGKMIERSEEEEHYARILGPNPVIQGTSIRLQTEEEVAKWLADRKAKWPSSKRIAEKAAESAQAYARGELSGRGRGRGAGGGALGKRARDPAAQAEDWGREPAEETFRRDTGRGRARGRGRGDQLGGGRGRGRGGHHSAPQSQGRPPIPTVPEATEPPRPAEKPAEDHGKIKMANSHLLAGLDDYSSDDLSDISSDSSLSGSSANSTSSDDGSGSDSDSESDSVTTSEDAAAANSSIAEPSPLHPVPDKPTCKAFSQNGKCKFGDKCRFAHRTGGGQAQGQESRPRPPRQPPPRKVNPFERPSLLGALLANPIQNTISQLSQTIRFLVANDMLEGVELRPGEVDEEQQASNKVVEL